MNAQVKLKQALLGNNKLSEFAAKKINQLVFAAILANYFLA
jgi:hypothetical protein